MVVTGSESPIVVVLSGSMEPAFHRGDLLFLTNYEQEDIRVGEIVVFKVGWPVSIDGAGNAHLNSEEEGSGSLVEASSFKNMILLINLDTLRKT